MAMKGEWKSDSEMCVRGVWVWGFCCFQKLLTKVFSRRICSFAGELVAEVGGEEELGLSVQDWSLCHWCDGCSYPLDTLKKGCPTLWEVFGCSCEAGSCTRSWLHWGLNAMLVWWREQGSNSGCPILCVSLDSCIRQSGEEVCVAFLSSCASAFSEGHFAG